MIMIHHCAQVLKLCHEYGIEWSTECNISEHYPNWDATESFMVFLFLLTSIKDAMRASALAF